MDGLSDGDAILAIINSSAVGKHMDIGAFRSEFAIPLCKVFAYRLRSSAEIVTEGASRTSLTSALPEEFTRYVGGVRWTPRALKAIVCRNYRTH